MQIQEKVKILNEYQLSYNNKIIDFDYLLIQSLDLIVDIQNLKILMDDGPVTNFFQQTSQEHIYFGNLELALDHLINGE